MSQPVRVSGVSAPMRPADIPPVPRPMAPPPPLPLVYDPPTDAVRSPSRSTPEFPAGDSASAREEAEMLAPIQQFLHAELAQQEEIAGISEYSYEPPPVEHFTDVLPDESGFAPPENEPAMSQDIMDPASLEGSAEWSEAEWQQFDWRSAAALGEAGDPAASDAWLDTDWEKPAAGRSERRESAAKAIADALDGIARRIREGDLALPSSRSGATPADIAATLAALLGGKRQAG
ncbi:MAG TPA: hypothetical protein VNO75_13045 [Gemmatimonadaceae bacterium]|nr:hypothetical protein [Gemmatimonadaceae bacterium]